MWDIITDIILYGSLGFAAGVNKEQIAAWFKKNKK